MNMQTREGRRRRESEVGIEVDGAGDNLPRVVSDDMRDDSRVPGGLDSGRRHLIRRQHHAAEISDFRRIGK